MATPYYKEIPYTQLVLDDTNPRLPKSLHGQSDSKIIEYLLLQASTLELMQAIGENDFFKGEQLLVIPINKDAYKVVEGNRRLTSVKLLNDYSLATVKKGLVKYVFDNANYRPKEIPCLVFTEEKEIKKYLGYRHITGIKAWGLSEKARYLYDLKEQFEKESFDDTCKELAKVIGSRKDYVKRVLVAFELYKIIEDEAFYQIKDLNDTTFYIGYYSDSLTHTNIANFLGIDLQDENPLKDLNKAHLKELTYWFYDKFEIDGKIKTKLKGKSGDLNDLNKVLANGDALASFREGYSLEKAVEFTEDLELIFSNSIKSSLNHLENADNISHKIKYFYKNIEDDLLQIRKLTIKIRQAKESLTAKDFEEDDF
jgi:hypothetical protein